MSHSDETRPQASNALAEFIRDHQDTILSAWEEQARELPPASDLPKLELQDTIPQLLALVADMIDAFAAGRDPELPADTAESHAFDRLEEGFDLAEMIWELSQLRECILQLWNDADVASKQDDEQQANLRQAIDRTIIASSVKYTEARDRALEALDGISSATMESRDLEELLDLLVKVFRSTVPSVDTVAVWLRDADMLSVRSVAGLQGDIDSFPSLRVGEGFVGKVAAEASSMQLRSASENSIVQSEALRSQDIKALYGAPLIADGEVIGVLHLGSLTSQEFSKQDLVLFRSMAGRAALGIRQHSLRQQAERNAEQLEVARLTLETLINQMPVGVVVAEPPHGNVVLQNEEATQLLGHEILAEDNYHQYVLYGGRHPDGSAYAPEEYATIRALFDGERVRAEELRYVRSDGDEVTFELSASPIRNSDGTIVAAVTTFWDISERKRAEAALRRSEARLQEALAQAQEAVGARERILAIVSHDLRDPIASIDLSSQVLLSVPAIQDDPTANKQVDVIQRNAARAIRLINDLMDFSALQAGSLALDAEESELSPILIEAVESHMPTARERHIALDYDAELDGARADVDRGRLLQAMSNLIGNALKFCEAGDRVDVKATREANEALITIADTGPGIAPDELEQLFTPYRKGRNAKPGVGLGLSIVKGIVKAHGGRLWVESQVGQGSTLAFTLPLSSDDMG